MLFDQGIYDFQIFRLVHLLFMVAFLATNLTIQFH